MYVTDDRGLRMLVDVGRKYNGPENRMTLISLLFYFQSIKKHVLERALFYLKKL